MSKNLEVAPEALPMQARGMLPIGSVDAEKRTVEVTFTTGAAVRRRRWTGWDSSVPFDEVLAVSRSAINMDRLNAGAPALDSHSAWSTFSQVGVVERAWISDKEGRALIRFPTKGVDEASDRMFAMVQEGIIRNISVGYSIDEVRVVEPQNKNEVEKRIVERWTPYEISFVTIPADAGAQTRSQESFPIIISRAPPAQLEQEPTMTDKPAASEVVADPNAVRTAPVAVPLAPVAPVAPTQISNDTLAAERARSAEITALATRHAMPIDFARQHIEGGTAIDSVRALVLDAVAARAAETPINGRVQIITDEHDTVRDAVEVAILHRAKPSSVKLTDAAREWRGMSMLEMGRAYHERVTGKTLRGMTRMELAGRILGLDDGMSLAQRDAGGGMATSDFPNILANVISKRLRNAYEVAPQHWKQLSNQNNAPDFKTRAITQLSNLPNFKKIVEGGEYQLAALTDGKEQYALATYGRKVIITRQAIINDDLSAFDRVPMLMGRAAAETEASIFWQILTANANLGDGVALFHATHANLAGSGSAITVASVGAGRKSMRVQKGLAKAAADAEPLNLAPKFILTSPDKETEVQQFLSTMLYAATQGNVNVFAGTLTPIVEARLTGNTWYLFADPALIDTIEYAYLDGEDGLYTESRLGFDVDGVEVKGRLDFAAKAIDYRGMYKDPGA